MARKARPKITAASAETMDMMEQIQHVRQLVAESLPSAHPNRQLQDDQVLAALLCAFFDPVCRSLRLVDQLSEVPGVQEVLGCDRVARSTLSDALHRFDLSLISPVVGKLREQLPALKDEDAALDRLVQQVIAADGSTFIMAGEVAWALQRKKDKKGNTSSEAKLHLQLDVRRWTMEKFAVTGSSAVPGGASEQAVQGRMLAEEPDLSNVIFLMDRGFCGFAVIRQMLEKPCHFVLRLKKDMVFRPQHQLPVVSGWATGRLGRFAVASLCLCVPVVGRLRLAG